MAGFDHLQLEEKWQKKWQADGLYKLDLKRAKRPYYNLMMFPYPSAEGLHVGNMYAFTGADIHGRYKAMQGLAVFEPIGLDGFGIHSENYAIEIGRHPAEQAKISEKRFYGQLRRIGNRFNWGNHLETYDPGYYRWTQWLFVQMFKRGLAYRKKSWVNWCPSCKTVLADEQVEGGLCERCKTGTTRKQTEQWFFKITAYAERLLNNLNKIDWPERIKTAQRNWIGRSEGAEIDWRVAGLKEKITTFTTRLDTLFGATFLVLAPEHKIAAKLLNSKLKTQNSKLVKKYINQALKKTEQQRKTDEKEKTGVDTGYLAIHPLTGEKIPIWVADFVLMDYGTGAIMAVPAHDERDFQFAKKFKLKIVEVVRPKKQVKGCYSGEGKLINSAEFNGLSSTQAKTKILSVLEKKKLGRGGVGYHLRDWLISRQRYWGPPIPMIFCPKCGWVSEKEENLPVELPVIEAYQPTGDGRSPLQKAPRDWLEVACPECGGAARRETDVSDTFLDSSWYYLRYPSVGLPTSGQVPFDEKITKKWLPVDAYIGGAEHAVLHLLYSRFVWMALQDWGYIPKSLGAEPFPFLFGHGLIIKDGAKMSKSRGNIVVPDKYIDKYGADCLRMYLMFIGPYEQGGDFRDTGIRGMRRFLNRVWRLGNSKDLKAKNSERLQHSTIKRVTEAVKKFRYNVAIAALMEYVNGLEANLKHKTQNSRQEIEVLAKLLAPFAPYLTEEMWQRLGHQDSVHQQAWPEYDSDLAKAETVTLVVQVNGKLRARLDLSQEEAKDKDKVLALAKEEEKLKQYLRGKKIVKPVFIPGRLINLVVE
jgi:leucyl-tRNA synthetase